MRGTRLLLRLVNEIGATRLLRDSGCLNQIASAHSGIRIDNSLIHFGGGK